MEGKGKGYIQFINATESPRGIESISFKPRKGSRYIVNVGSVGYPRNDLCATYAIWDSETGRVTLRRLPFDFKVHIMRMLDRKVNLPMWLCDLLMAAAGKGKGDEKQG